MTDNDKPEFFGGNDISQDQPEPQKRDWMMFYYGVCTGCLATLGLVYIAKAVIDMWVG